MKVNTFFWRLSLSFMGLLLLSTAMMGLLFYRTTLSVQESIEQQVQWGLAEHLVQDLRPHLSSTFDKKAIEIFFGHFCLRNPRVDLYLLDVNGAILASTGRPYIKFIDIAPVAEFIQRRGIQRDPIRTIDPKEPNKTKIFSASTVSIAGQPGYLVAILQSPRINPAIQMYRDPLAAEDSTLLFVGLLFGTWITASITVFYLTRRFHRLTAFVKKYEQGDYSLRVDESGGDEISSLSRALNSMAAIIESNIAQLETTDALRRALVANISHDLRIPISVIRAGLDTLVSELGSLDKRDIRELIEQTLANVGFLNDLISQLFELSKLEARQEPPSIVAFSVAELAFDTVHKFLPRAKTTGISITAEVPDEVNFAFGDIEMLDRVLSNLVENAIQHTPPHGTIRLQLELKGDRVAIRVVDSGKGMNEEELTNVFERFYRAPSTRSANPSGAGLGLSIASKIVELHGAKISVTSKLGVGSSFEFLLRVANRLS